MMARKGSNRIRELTVTVEAIIYQKGYANVEDLPQIKRTLLQFINIFNDMGYKNRLTPQQQTLHNQLLLVESLLKEMMFIQTQQSVWELLDSGTKLLQCVQTSNDQIQYQEERLINMVPGQEVLGLLSRIENTFNDLIQNKPCFQAFKRWMFNRLLGTAEQMRIELESQFKTKRIQLKGHDGKIIDCLMIFGTNAPNISASQEPFQADDIQLSDVGGELTDIGPTILFCNPNAGYYEFMFYESEWIDYYHRRGINLFLWNYRGYCESGGFPSTKAILRDGETVVDFLRSQYHITKLGVHGESLGGMFACHLAKTKNLNYLFADRTFASLSEVARVGFSGVAKFLFNLITDWNYESTQAYIDTTCYKVMAADPRDEVIPFLASLQTGVAKKVFKSELKPDKFKLNQNGFLKAIRRTRHICQEKRSIRLWYEHIIPQKEYEATFYALKRVISVLEEFQQYRIENKISKPTKVEPYQHHEVDDGSQSEPRQPVNDTNTSLLLNQTIDLQPDEASYSHPSMLSMQQQNPARYPFDLTPTEKALPSFQLFVENVRQVFVSMESASITLLDIFTIFNPKQQWNALISFFINMFLWGAHLPIKNINVKKLTTLQCQKLAHGRLNDFMKSLDLFIKTEKKDKEANYIQKRILYDLEFILGRVKFIKENMKKLIKQKYVISSVQSPQGQGYQVEMVDRRNFEEKPPTSEKIPSSQYMDSINKQLGNFFPLRCGHNGLLQKREIAVLDYHLTNAGFKQQ